MSFPFREDPNAATILCKHIARGEKPILYVSHDEDDGSFYATRSILLRT